MSVQSQSQTRPAMPGMPDRFMLLCRRVRYLFYGYLTLSLALAGTAVSLRDHLAGAVWSRVIGLLISSAVCLVIANRLAVERRWAYVRLRILSVVGAVAVLVIIVVPGPYPLWMRLMQIGHAAILIAVAATLARPAIRERFARPARQEAR